MITETINPNTELQLILQTIFQLFVFLNTLEYVNTIEVKDLYKAAQTKNEKVMRVPICTYR